MFDKLEDLVKRLDEVMQDLVNQMQLATRIDSAIDERAK